MKNQKEVWLPVKGYEGCYEVSNIGNIKSLKYGKERILKLTFSRGYYKVDLNKNGKRKPVKIHQLVAMAFLNHKPNGNKLVVDHINNNKLDNRLENLQIITNRENLSKDKKGSSEYTGVSWHKTNKKWCSTIRIKGVSKHLGVFRNPKIARAVYLYELEQIKNYEAIDKQKVLSIYNLITRL